MTGSQVAALENAKNGLRRAIRPFVPVAIRAKEGRRRLKGITKKTGHLVRGADLVAGDALSTGEMRDN
jgi:hypothetical protein